MNIKIEDLWGSLFEIKTYLYHARQHRGNGENY